MSTKKTFRITITIIIILIISGLIFYPKLKPMFKSGEQKGMKGGPGAGAGAGRGQQVLLASGYVIVPTKMSDPNKSNGSLLPDEEVELSFETSGKVVGIYFQEGTRVKKGDLLAKINDKPLQAQLLKLQAQRKLLEEREFRQKQLLERDAISRESYDQVSTELQSLQADILLLEARIAETEMHAPFDGIVGLRMISEGAFANTQTKIVRLVKVSPLKIEFSIPERYAGEVKPGFPITFAVSGSNNRYSAKVYAVEPKIDIVMKTIVVRALYPNSNEELNPGRFVDIYMELSQIDNTISIPTEAVIPEMDGEKVFVFKNGKAEQRKVELGLRTADKVQVKSGLEFGDTLLTTAMLQLRHLLPVKLDTLVTNQNPEILVK